MDLKIKNKEASHAVGFHLYEMSRTDKSIETGRLAVAWGWGRNRGQDESDLMGLGFIYRMKKISKTWLSWWLPKVDSPEATELYILNGRTLQFLIYTSIKNFFLKNNEEDFPGSPVVKNLPSNTWDASLIPGQGTKIPQAMGQLNLGITMKRSCMLPPGSRALVSQLEKPQMPQRRPTCHNEVP